MICPHCEADTSDMMNVCELCGQPLRDAAEHSIAEPPPGDATIGLHRPPGETTLSEWPLPGTGSAGQKSSSDSRWYLSPWPYLIGIAVVAAVVVSLFVFRSSVKAYPELLVNGQPTLLNFYTDT
jgi:hypothetical protein